MAIENLKKLLLALLISFFGYNIYLAKKRILLFLLLFFFICHSEIPNIMGEDNPKRCKGVFKGLLFC